MIEYSLTLTYRVGVFATLTNSYALVAVGASENFYRYGSLASPEILHQWAQCGSREDERADGWTVFSRQSYKMSSRFAMLRLRERESLED